MSAFDINGKFFKNLTKAGDFVLLFFLVIIFSIPVVTAGTSLTAAFYVGLKLVRDEEGYVFKDFWKSWKQNLKQGIVIELILVVLAVLLIADIYICYQWSVAEGNLGAQLLMFASIGMLLVLGAEVIYIFPVLARFDNTVLALLKNSLLLCMHHLPQTIIMMIATYGLIYFISQYFVVIFIIGPLILYIDSFIFARILKQYMPEAAS
jgi:uncharacterized membrane protein YesL